MTGPAPLALLSSDAGAVAVGAVFGALSRYQAGEMAAQWIAKDPTKRVPFQGWHTAGINVAGSFALGSLAGIPTKAVTPAVTPGLSPRTKLMMGVGFCGSFTTFSTFSVDVAKWVTEGQIGKATGYVLTNNVGGIVAAAAGMVIMKKFFG
ncbi:Putative fluoride ion transporter CrcB [Seminavis robusta]|uniref:Fluoride ion transporter CrcB n=1 Tax=Seminavis robusta TaxID=568900 RepID=A0A9N8F282_9STRA|nr:Putative fluoride ion transporter CrcB [Seminavis robusta]|eukprot:Sro3433_g347990.1 Putative fluoride ion transporter CrcB (150) ;mRNA; r:5529-5978